MQAFGIFIIAIVAMVIFWRWRAAQSIKGIIGISVPDAARQKISGSDSVLFYFYHPSCGSCRSMSTLMDTLLETYPKRIIKINVADEPALAIAFKISATPTTLLAKNGSVADAFVGPKSIQKIDALLRKRLN